MIGIGELVESNEAQEFKRGCATLIACDFAHFKSELNVAARSPPREKLRKILEDDAAIVPVPVDDGATDQHFAGSGLQKAGDHVHDRRLAATAGTCLLYTSPSPRDRQ